MPRGFAREAREEIEARKNSSGAGASFFKLPNDKDTGVVRFLEDEPTWAWVHDLPKTGTSYQSAPCLDQDSETGARNGEACPGCDNERQSAQEVGWKDRKYRRHLAGVSSVIWRDAPVYHEDEQSGNRDYSKVVGKADQIAKWTFGKNILEDLDGIAATFKGLTSRDFKITRYGEGLGTTYDIKPVVDENGDTKAQKMSAADEKLAEEAPDLTDYYKKPSYEDWGKSTSSSGSSGGSVPPPVADASPFTRRREES